jgi:hypothetical protein
MEIARELHKPVIKKFSKRKIITKGIDDLWGIDLLIFDKYSKQNNGYKYALIVIDTFSKMAFVEPIKNKTGEVVTKAFEKVIKNYKRKPNLIHADKGTEFVNQTFQKMLEKHNIKMYHTYNEEKSAIAERFIRTLNQKLRPYFSYRKNFKWVDIIEKIVNDYNTKDVHKTIGMRPIDVNKNNEEEIKIKMYKRAPASYIIPKKTKFKIGDRVRIYAYKNTFNNKYKKNWTNEIFVIDKVFYGNPIVYKIVAEDGEDILGIFYENQLLKTKF